MKNELLKNIKYDDLKVSIKQRIINFLIKKEIIKSPNYIFGGF